MNSHINIRGARTHNLKNISVDIPKNQLVVITGLSGSGKSSLAFDTIYAEGQRRYVESLSSYARQFLGMMEKPDVDSIEGLSPAISIDQKTTSHNPRSTVGTVTEIYDYLRVLFARIGIPHCPNDGTPITAKAVDQIVDEILAFPIGSKLEILSPVVRERKGSYHTQLERYREKGFINAYIDGEQRSLEEEDIVLNKTHKHSISLIVDRLILKESSAETRSRIAESVEVATKESQGLLIVKTPEGEKSYSTIYACSQCGFSLPEIHPRIFSFNLPEGACDACSGLGYILSPQPDLILFSEGTLDGNGVQIVGDMESSKWYRAYLEALAIKYHFRLDVPIKKLPAKVVDVLLYGTGEEAIEVRLEGGRSAIEFNKPFEGFVPMVSRRYRETQSEHSRSFYEKFMLRESCPTCQGLRLKPALQFITIQGGSIGSITTMSVQESLQWFSDLKLSTSERQISEKVVQEIQTRLSFLQNVGLGYLSLHRNAGTLSGGEMQRIRLAAQIGTKLTGILYVLDEPSIGLHQRDNDKLIQTLVELQSLGNTLIVVEHDEQIIRTADHIIDMGPGAGIFGGDVLSTGSLQDILKNKDSLTSQYLSGKKFLPIPQSPRKGSGKKLTLKGVKTNNLKNITVSFPLGTFIAVTGVSGSGKSSLVRETLVPACQKHLSLQTGGSVRAKYDKVEGLGEIDSLIHIDQSPIGRTPRSNPATYVKIFDLIRQVFAQTNQAKVKGYTASRFSFNVKGGRCENCSGDGVRKIEMHFLADVYVECDVCHGRRYNQETLDVFYKGKNIYDVLQMSIREAYDFFQNHNSIGRILQTLLDVGLDYIKLGQNSTTLSGGEAQRIKLSRELAKRFTGKTLYVLDEPTTGLHFADVHKLVDVLQKLADAGNTVVVIEHNLDLIKTADHIIDIGPEGGDSGGELLAEGTPKHVSKVKSSYTGYYLQEVFRPEKSGSKASLPKKKRE